MACALTRIIREEGVMNALICSEPPADLTAIKSYAVRDGVKTASCKAPQSFPAEGEEKFHVALLDHGAKQLHCGKSPVPGCRVTVSVSRYRRGGGGAGPPSDGLMLSNGPGDPKENSLETGSFAQSSPSGSCPSSASASATSFQVSGLLGARR